MNILIYNWRDIKNPEGGGAEVFTHEIAKRWVENGNNVTFFTSAFSGCKNEEKIDGIKFIRRGNKYSVYKEAKKYYKNHFYKKNFDIIIDEINTKPFLTPKFVNGKETIVALIHQLAREFWFYETSFPINFAGYYFFEKYWLSNYRNIPTITVSNSTKNDLLKLKFKKIFVVSEGIKFTPLPQIPEKTKNPSIIFVGRLKKAKRPDYVVKAFKKIVKDIPQTELWVVGDGYLRKDLEEIADKNVKFFGYVSEKEKIELLSKAWVLVNPSIREGWGINIIEANACGTPCIAFDVPGLRDSIVDGKTGLLVKDKSNIQQLAKTIVEFIKKPRLREEFNKNALDWSKRFTWDKSSEEFIHILISVIN
jgi:glycosyltransferase involved in cell wall biosynthesis